MSVAFYPKMDSSVPHALVCACRAWKSTEIYANRFDAYQASLAGAKSNCTDPYCGECVYAEPEIYEPEVQLSNVNAEELLDYLQISVGGDFEDRCTGSLSSGDMLERVSWALNIAPVSSGLATMRVDNIIYCGRPSDYIRTKLAQVGEVAQWAKANDRDVVWG